MHICASMGVYTEIKPFSGKVKQKGKCFLFVKYLQSKSSVNIYNC